MRRTIPSRGAVKNQDESVSDPRKDGLGRVAERISYGPDKNELIEDKRVSIASKRSRGDR